MKISVLTPRTLSLALIVALTTLTISFAGWSAQAGRGPLGSGFAQKHLAAARAWVRAKATSSLPASVGMTSNRSLATTAPRAQSSCPTITVTNPVQYVGVVGSSDTQIDVLFTQTGGVGNVTFSLDSGTLPSGWPSDRAPALDSNGRLWGSIGATGTFPITVKVTDSNGCVGISPTYNLTILDGGLGEPDLSTMVALRDQFSWGIAFAWPSSSNPCPNDVNNINWNGVNCLPTNNQLRVATVLLTCGNNKLTTPFPNAEIPTLTGMTRFDLRTCYIAQQSASNFSGLDSMTQLLRLRLDHNPGITGSINDIFPTGLNPTRFNALTLFVLTNTSIGGQIPEGVMQFSNATQIWLNHARFNGTLPANGNTAKRLRLQGNALEGDLPTYIRNATGEVYLRYNKFNVDSTPMGSNIDTLDPLWRTTQTVPPTNVQVTPQGANTAKLTWTPIAYTQHGGYYEVLSSQTQGGPYFSRGTTTNSGAKTATELTVTGLPGGTNYFVVRTFTPAHTGVFPQGCTSETACVTENNPNDLTSVNSAEVSTTITCPTITVTNPGTTTGTAGTAFSQQFTQLGGVGATTFSTTSTLPTGLTLASDGTLSGTPTQAGTFSITVQATDSNSCMGTGANYNLSICLTNPVVTTNADSGAGSLREAIAIACPGSTITFANTVVSPIVLTSGELVINKNLTIQGPGASQLTVQRSTAMGTPNFRIFRINSGVTGNLSGMTITGGKGGTAGPYGCCGGGGIFNSGTLTIRESAVSGNSASSGSLTNFGAGIFNVGVLTIINSTISGNTVSGGDSRLNSGGGISNFSGASLILVNSTISGNTVSGTGLYIFGGGIRSFDSILNITNSTISGNTVSGGSITKAGGGIYIDSGTGNAVNTIISDNTAATDPDLSGTLTTNTNNLIGGSAMLGPLANNGGPTQTHRPLPNSPAINAGSNCVLDNTCMPALGFNLTTDQRGTGFNRQIGSHVDIGAVETNYVLAATGGNNQNATVNTAFADPLLVTLTESGQPVSGAAISFTPPLSGASSSLSSSSAMTNASGQASVTATANGTVGGPYNVVAAAQASTSVNFALTNTLLLAELKTQLADPAVCLGAGGLIGITATVTNPNAVAVNASFTAKLPLQLLGQPGTGTATVNPLGVTVTPATVTWTGMLAANQTVTINYEAQIANGTPLNSQLCINNEASFNGGPATMLPYCFMADCPPLGLVKGSGNVRTSDQKAGSFLVFPYYTSTANGQQDTRLTLSNVLEEPVTVHLFFLDGASCQQADMYVCLTPWASLSFKASEFDPETTGFIYAVAVNERGVPIQHNGLIGNAFVRDGDYVDNYGAEAFWRYDAGVTPVTNGVALLSLNGAVYDAAPVQFAVELQSPVDVVGKRIVVAPLSGDVSGSANLGAATLSLQSAASMVGIGLAVNAEEKRTSFGGLLSGGCLKSGLISTTFPRVPGGLGQLLPSSKGGHLQFRVGAGVGLLMTPKGGVGQWSGIRGLHKTAVGNTVIAIPVFVPVC